MSPRQNPEYEMCIRDRVELVRVQRLRHRVDDYVHLVVGIQLRYLVALSHRPTVALGEVGRSPQMCIRDRCEWIGANKTIGNPFEGCTKKEFNAHMNYSAEYTRCV